MNTILSVRKPTVPFTAKFTEELGEESIIVIKGKLTDDPLRFDVNFQRGDSPEADILFHFNPRFKEELEKIIFNSRGPDGWGFQGEKYENITTRGSSFKLVFVVWRNCFQVSVSGRHILEFPHRIEEWKPDTVIVFGDIEVESIDVLRL
ncbi:galectin-8-like [Callorhinchus milii]|uniref:galectin-8-like n=1 Tax=Callorhinchus milii TaxID=7868 RepID=UPI00045753A0|nr:galectin-8-like [Callorhinchus milii]|eukprot:gi/632981193/ref/XP_007907457.1/ PREDICTED: galectin-8-like [Callorhinchus milii]